MLDATDHLRDVLAAIACNDRDTAYEALRDLMSHVGDGGELPIVELLGPADLRYPDPDRIRVAV